MESLNNSFPLASLLCKKKLFFNFATYLMYEPKKRDGNTDAQGNLIIRHFVTIKLFPFPIFHGILEALRVEWQSSTPFCFQSIQWCWWTTILLLIGVSIPHIAGKAEEIWTKYTAVSRYQSEEKLKQFILPSGNGTDYCRMYSQTIQSYQ